jgi:hypothetical protein
MSSARAAKWEFFVTRWGALYDWVSGAVRAAQDGAAAGGARVGAEEAARMGVLLRKAVRARQVLLQVRAAAGQRALKTALRRHASIVTGRPAARR